MAAARGYAMRRPTLAPAISAAQAVAAITLLAALLRFLWIDSKGYWQDEAATVFLNHASFGAMLDGVLHKEATPPLYFVLAWLWDKPFGSGEAALRSFSALVGTAAVPAAYLAAKELVSRRAGVATALLVAVNPLLVWYGQEARAYVLLVLLAALSLLFLARALHAPDDRLGRAVGWWALVAVAALLTQHFAFLLILPEVAWLLYRRGATRATLPTAALTVAVTIAMLVLAAGSQDRGEWIEGSGLAGRAVQIPGVFLVGFETPSPLVVAALGAACAAVALWLLATRATPAERRSTYLPGSLALIVLGSELAAALIGLDFLLYRNVIHALVPVVIVLGAGFAVRGGGVAGPLALGVLCAISVAVVVATAHQPKYRKEVWREVAHALGPAPAGRAIVATPADESAITLAVYLPGTRRMAAAGARVREIAVVGSAYRKLGSLAEPVTPRPATPPPPPAPGFRLAGQRKGERFTIFTYRSPTALAVRPLTLSRDRLARVKVMVLLQPR